VPSPTKAGRSSQGPYRSDFGIHNGKSVAEAPSDYVQFLKDRGIVDGKPALAAAVAAYEQDHPPISSQPTSTWNPDQYVFTFGKHAGKLLKTVPTDYLLWLKSSPIYTENHTVRSAIQHYEKTYRALVETPPSPPKSKSKSKRASYTANDVSRGSGSTSDRYRFQKNGSPILITPSEASEYFGVRRHAGLSKVSMRNKYVTVHLLKDVRTYAKREGTCAQGETSDAALKRFKRECADLDKRLAWRWFNEEVKHGWENG
jgi:uncharacterized protein (DUF3820 family)